MVGAFSANLWFDVQITGEEEMFLIGRGISDARTMVTV